MKNNRLFYKKFFKYFLILVVIFALSLAATNIYLDKSGIFKNDYSKQKFWPNERFIKTKYLLKNPNKYDSFLLGSSRIDLLNPKLIKAGHYYNFSFPMSTIYENLRYLNLLIKKGYKIKTIVLCLDHDTFKHNEYPYSPFGSIDQAYLYYPETIYQKIKVYSNYIFINPFAEGNKQLPFTDLNNKSIFDTGTTAQFLDLKTYKRPAKKINKAYKAPYGYNSVNLKLLKEFKQLCNQHNINLIIVILPEYYKLYKTNNLPGYNECKKELSKITPYYDFSGINEITSNDINFFDFDHFDYIAACKILDRIFNEDKFSAPKIEGFGDYVTKDNFSEHIKTLCSKTPEIKNCIPESSQ